MTARAQTQWPVTLAGTRLSIVADPTRPEGADPEAYTGSFQTQDSALGLTRRDVAIKLRRFSRGSGFMERRDADDDGDYAQRWGIW